MLSSRLTQRLSNLPLMVIGSYRDAELNVTRPLAKTLEDLLRGHLATRIRLKGLPRDEVAAMLNSLSGKSAPAAVVGEIFAETGGNPFFVEELFRHLEEENRLYDSAGQFRADLKIGETDAPPSVRLVVARRVARLSDPTQKMLATAATIGPSFSFEILQISGPRDARTLLDCIEEAEKAGLILSIAGSPKARFAFSHELIRQAVIGGLSAARRQSLHLEIADAMERTLSPEMESTSATNLDNHFADLAYHYARGGNPAKAVRYYLHAVRRFAYLGSSAEAIAQFESALASLGELPDDDRRAELELDLRIAVSDPLGDLKGLASVEYERSSERALALSQRPSIRWGKGWTALYSCMFVHLVRPNQRRACEVAAELVSRAERHEGAEHLFADSGTYLACARMYSGEFEPAAEGFDRSWELLETIAKADLTPQRAEQMRRARNVQRRLGSHENNRGLSAWNLWFLGYPDRALERMSVASRIAYSGTRTMLADIHGFASYLHELRREPDEMRERAEARLALSTESSYAIGRPLSEIYLGWADAIAGDLEGGIERIRINQLQMKSAGSELASDRCAAFIATSLGHLKRFDEGLRTIDEAFQFIERTGQKYYDAELHRLKGELLLRKDRSSAARAQDSFVTAIEIARRQHAKSWELRATTSLARLLAKNRKRDQARVMLSELYDWFTEGFDTADLREAKALLEQLSG
jgi:tetratricopeptide (TPR) repeat protein